MFDTQSPAKYYGAKVVNNTIRVSPSAEHVSCDICHQTHARYCRTTRLQSNHYCARWEKAFDRIQHDRMAIAFNRLGIHPHSLMQ